MAVKVRQGNETRALSIRGERDSPLYPGVWKPQGHSSPRGSNHSRPIVRPYLARPIGPPPLPCAPARKPLYKRAWADHRTAHPDAAEQILLIAERPLGSNHRLWTDGEYGPASA